MVYSGELKSLRLGFLKLRLHFTASQIQEYITGSNNNDKQLTVLRAICIVYHSNSSTCVNLHNIHNSPRRQVPLSPFHR